MKMPKVYLAPLGTPLYWKDEQSGVLSKAITAYLFNGAEKAPEPRPEQIELVIEYLQYFILAPCWKGDELPNLRKESLNLKTLEDINKFLWQCLEIGLDPF